MFVLSRKNQQSVVIRASGTGERLLKVTVVEITAQSVRLGFEVDPDVPDDFRELRQRMRASAQLFGPMSGPAPPVA
jgi:sRNA-binding carbon storage regulator CsrA